eukprot:1396571-Rhodomonas_salina.1
MQPQAERGTERYAVLGLVLKHTPFELDSEASGSWSTLCQWPGPGAAATGSHGPGPCSGTLRLAR